MKKSQSFSYAIKQSSFFKKVLLIASNISEILLNVFPVYSIAPDKRTFPAPVLLTIGWDRNVCICAFHRGNKKSFSSSYICNFYFLLTNKTITEQQQQA